MRPETRANRDLWDTWTPLHVGSDFYDVASFRAGGSTLAPIEIEEIGDVTGKSLLHLQCHFGLDTLSWARRGARVTGVDFSATAIERAQALAEELGLDARFVCADVEALGDVLPDQFDVIFTSYGVLSWLSDLRPWARAIARALRPGGFFYLVEFHPVLGMLDETGSRLKYSYFADPVPVVSDETATYAGAEHPPMPCYQWSHGLSDIIAALVDAGLRLDYLHEFPYCVHPCYPYLVESEPGRYVVRDYPGALPLLFSIRASH